MGLVGHDLATPVFGVGAAGIEWRLTSVDAVENGWFAALAGRVKVPRKQGERPWMPQR